MKNNSRALAGDCPRTPWIGPCKLHIPALREQPLPARPAIKKGWEEVSAAIVLLKNNPFQLIVFRVSCPQHERLGGLFHLSYLFHPNNPTIGAPVPNREKSGLFLKEGIVEKQKNRSPLGLRSMTGWSDDPESNIIVSCKVNAV